MWRHEPIRTGSTHQWTTEWKRGPILPPVAKRGKSNVRRCLVNITTSSRALIGYGTLRKRVKDLKKGEDQNRKFFWKSLENHIIKWRRRLLVSIFLKLCRLSKVSAVDFFDLFDPLHGISRVIFQVINTFWLKNTKKCVLSIGDGDYYSQTV